MEVCMNNIPGVVILILAHLVRMECSRRWQQLLITMGPMDLEKVL